MSTSTSIAPAPFQKAFPLEAHIKNHFGNDSRAALYIVNNLNSLSKEQTVTISVTASDDGYTLKGWDELQAPAKVELPVANKTTTKAPSNVSFTPQPKTQTDLSTYNLAIAFRPGTLNKEVEKNFTLKLYQAIAESFKGTDNCCAVNGPIPRTDDGALVWYIAFAKDLNATAGPSGNEFLSFTLKGVAADLGEGARVSQVEFKFSNVQLASEAASGDYRNGLTLDIVNHDGYGYAPLHMGLLGNGVLLNNTTLPQELTFFLQTTNGLPLPLSQDRLRPTEIHFNFPYQNPETTVMYLGNSSQVKALNFTSGTYQYPINTTSVGTDNGDGFIEFKGNFSELEEISQSLMPEPQAAKERAVQLFLQGLNEFSEKVEALVAQSDSQCKSLVDWMTSPDRSYNKSFNDYKSTYSLGVSLRPTVDIPACGFDLTAWSTIRNPDYNSGIPNFGKSLPPSFNYNGFGSNTGEGIYVAKNYTSLASELFRLAPQMKGSLKVQSAIGNNHVEIGSILPCDPISAFFSTKHSLHKSIELLKSTFQPGSGVQLAAITCVHQQMTTLKQKAEAKSKLLAKYISSSNGPLVTLPLTKKYDSVPEGGLDSWSAADENGNLMSIDFCCTGTGTVTPFSATEWKAFGTQFGGSWDTLPVGVTTTYDPDTSWNDQDFLTYVQININTLCSLLLAYNPNALYNKAENYSYEQNTSTSDFNVDSGKYRLLPCLAVYEFFRTQYELDNALTNIVSEFMLDIDQPYSAEQWTIAKQNADVKFGTYKGLLDESANGGVKQNLSYPPFVKYLESNFASICKQLSPYVVGGKRYVVPSQSLYEVLWFSYQSTLSPQALPLQNLMNPSDYVFRFTNVLPWGSNGSVPIGITLRNIPGYWDTHFKVYARLRTPKTFASSNLSIGIADGQGRTDISASDPNYSVNQKINQGSRIDFNSAGTAEGLPNVSIEEHYGLNLYGTFGQKLPGTGQNPSLDSNAPTARPVAVKEADLLIEDGRLGIGNVPEGKLSGDFTLPTTSQGLNPDKLKLKVEGGGSLLTSSVSSDVVVGENANFYQDIKAAEIKVQGNMATQHPIETERLFAGPGDMLIPVGTIISRLYLYTKNPTAPKGWVICDGTTNLIDLMVGNGDGPLNEDYLPLALHLANKFPLYGKTKKGSFSSQTQIKPDPNKAGKYFFYDPVNDVESLIHVHDYKIIVPEASPMSGFISVSFTDDHYSGTNHAQPVYLMKM